jgi:hypothetical protein
LQRYAESFQSLLRYWHLNWRDIGARGAFDLTKAFPGQTADHALNVHLFFVGQLAERLRSEKLNVPLASFDSALAERTPHPDVTLLVCSTLVPSGRLLSYDPTVSVLRSGDAIQSALWMHWAHPVAIKVCYIQPGAPVREPDGFPWHPTRQRKIVKLSPYKGDAEPRVARRDLRI